MQKKIITSTPKLFSLSFKKKMLKDSDGGILRLLQLSNLSPNLFFRKHRFGINNKNNDVVAFTKNKNNQYDDGTAHSFLYFCKSIWKEYDNDITEVNNMLSTFEDVEVKKLKKTINNKHFDVVILELYRVMEILRMSPKYFIALWYLSQSVLTDSMKVKKLNSLVDKIHLTFLEKQLNFKEKLKETKRKNNNDKEITPSSIINVDTTMTFRDYLSSKSIGLLPYIINLSWNMYVILGYDPKSKAITFDDEISIKTKKYSIKMIDDSKLHLVPIDRNDLNDNNNNNNENDSAFIEMYNSDLFMILILQISNSNIGLKIPNSAKYSSFFLSLL